MHRRLKILLIRSKIRRPARGRWLPPPDDAKPIALQLHARRSEEVTAPCSTFSSGFGLRRGVLAAVKSPQREFVKKHLLTERFGKALNIASRGSPDRKIWG